MTGALGEKKGFIITLRNTSCTSLKNCRMESSLLSSCSSRNFICAAVTKADTCMGPTRREALCPGTSLSKIEILHWPVFCQDPVQDDSRPMRPKSVYACAAFLDFSASEHPHPSSRNVLAKKRIPQREYQQDAARADLQIVELVHHPQVHIRTLPLLVLNCIQGCMQDKLMQVLRPVISRSCLSCTASTPAHLRGRPQTETL